jgi:diguanylate cyclase (GGDEF)-like protein
MRRRLPLSTTGLRTRLWAIIIIVVAYLVYSSLADFIPYYWEKIGFEPLRRSILTLGMVVILLICLSGLAISERMTSLITKEGLTGLFNQSYIRQRLEEEFYRSKRYDHPLSLLLIGLDNFRTLNRQYGRAAGDHLLKYFARLIHETIRPSDIAARFSGGEFLIILPETSRQEAEVVAERLQKRIVLSPFRIDSRQEDIQFTISIGVSAYPEAGQSADELITLSDIALSEAN